MAHLLAFRANHDREVMAVADGVRGQHRARQWCRDRVVLTRHQVETRALAPCVQPPPTKYTEYRLNRQILIHSAYMIAYMP